MAALGRAGDGCSEERTGSIFRVVSADASVPLQGWPDRSSFQCRATGSSTPTNPVAHRPAPASLSPDVEGIEDSEPEGEHDGELDGELVLYTEHAPDLSDGPGLGCINPNGRAQVLQEWCLGHEVKEAPPPAAMSVRPNSVRPLEALRSLLRPTPPPANGCMDGIDIEWSSLADAAKHALKQWCAGQLGGRHCMLIVEHNSGIDTSTVMEEPGASNLRGGAALNVLSGLQAEVELMSQHCGSWLFEECFSKPPTKVLEQAIAVALEEIGDPHLVNPSDLSVEQANLALRRRAMKVQCVSPFIPPSADGGPRSSDEFVRTQVWLELLRQCAEGPKESAHAKKDKDQASKAEKPPPPWGDGGVMRDLGKTENDLEAESEKMSLESIRMQNRHIEDYVMRLVRQRDELKSMMKLVEERDSYFILGLEGPESTEEEVKKAYRALARKEHPDKAGIGNKRRFQAIQQAYTSILRQKGDGALLGQANDLGPENKTEAGDRPGVSPIIMEAIEQSRRAKDAADGVAACAHQAIRSNEDCTELQNAPKRKALRVMRDLTTRSIAELRGAAACLRTLGTAVCNIANCADAAMNEHKEAADKTVAGVGLRDRAIIVEDAGRSSITSADLLEKISEATEATLRKVEKADAPGSADSAMARAGRDEAGNLLRLGVRLLSESLARTAAVARRSADEAIGAAVKAHELSRGLAAVDMEARKEREKAAAKSRSFDGEEEVIAADDAPRTDGTEGSSGAPATGGNPDELPPKTPRGGNDATGGTSPRDQLKSAAKRVKERHVALRVKNLTFLTALNEEALRLQGRLRSLLDRSEGALLPEVSILQKKQVFDLVAQLLNFTLAELSRLVVQPNVAATAPNKVFDRVLSFALALEHSRDVAMPAESRTQALKLAAFIDADLLCQIISGPFRARLLAAISRKSAAPSAVLPGRLKVRNSSADMTAKAWSETATACCERIVKSVKALNVQPLSCGDGDAPLA